MASRTLPTLSAVRRNLLPTNSFQFTTRALSITSFRPKPPLLCSSNLSQHRFTKTPLNQQTFGASRVFSSTISSAPIQSTKGSEYKPGPKTAIGIFIVVSVVIALLARRKVEPERKDGYVYIGDIRINEEYYDGFQAEVMPHIETGLDTKQLFEIIRPCESTLLS